LRFERERSTNLSEEIALIGVFLNLFVNPLAGSCEPALNPSGFSMMASCTQDGYRSIVALSHARALCRIQSRLLRHLSRHNREWVTAGLKEATLTQFVKENGSLFFLRIGEGPNGESHLFSQWSRGLNEIVKLVQHLPMKKHHVFFA